MSLVQTLLLIVAAILGLWSILELVMRQVVGGSLPTGFYSAQPPADSPAHSQQPGVMIASGPGWIHLGWIADPNRETYRVELHRETGWDTVRHCRFGSALIRNLPRGDFRVLALPKDGSPPRLIGEASATAGETPAPLPLYRPRLAGPWQMLFRPSIHGNYINDHTIYQDAAGNWRLLGITDQSDGNYNHERYFASACSTTFPPPAGMLETDPVADFGELAWAPHVIRANDRYHLFWSPHKLHQMTSADGIHWQDHRITLAAPYHKFFRDPMVLQVAEGQWLLYTTARGRYFSQIDIYQSFDLHTWQYIRTALRSSWGSERNSPFASMESPFVTAYQGRYYLSLTYNNDSFFWPGILMLFHVWPERRSYNETLVFQADNPYDFGCYRGKKHTPNLLTTLEAHAPEIIYQPETDTWYITTAGWPWVASLTSGEVAIALLKWEKISQ